MEADIFDAAPDPDPVRRPRWKAQGITGGPVFRCSFTDDQGRRQVMLVEAPSPYAAQARAIRDGAGKELVVGNYHGAKNPKPTRRRNGARRVLCRELQ